MTAHVVNERVSGTRRFSVSHETSTAYHGAVSKVCIWRDDRAEVYGRAFESSAEVLRFHMERGYIRPYFTNPHLRLRRQFDAYKVSQSWKCAYQISDEEALRQSAILKRLNRSR